MAQETRFTSYGSYDEQIAGAIDLDEGDSQFRRHRPMAAKGGFAADDPMPLFLSGHAEQPGRPVGKVRDKPALASRILKASILAASAAAIVLAALSVENPLALFANAKASLIGVAAGQTGPAPTAQIQSAAEPVRTDRSASPAQPAPTRDEIATALRAAHQGQPEVRQPPAAAPVARRLDADELAALLKRAKNMIAIGDIPAARLLLERAADAQEASAALLLAQTYDPVVLGTPDMRSITPDPALARSWYQKAARFGSPEAQQRLAQMQN